MQMDSDVRSARAVAAGFLLLVAGGCRAPTASIERPWGVVEARTMADAQRLAAAVEEARKTIAAHEGFSDRALTVRYVDPIESLPLVRGYSSGDVVGVVAGLRGSALHSVVAHELVHALVAPAYRELPHVVEEGLADMTAPSIGMMIQDAIYLPIAIGPSLPNFTSLSRMIDAADLPSVEACLRSTPQQYTAADVPARTVMWAVGRVLARRIGAARLLELCRQARRQGQRELPPDLLLVEAGLDPADATTWLECVGFVEVHLERSGADGAAVRDRVFRGDEELPFAAFSLLP